MEGAALSAARPRVLLAITVYNGRSFVPRTVYSAARLSQEVAEVDVVLLDDASPDTEFAADLSALAAELGLGYYRTPRNLGIVRNVNLGLLRGLDAGYDYVVVSNSDVVYPQTMVDEMVRAMEADPTVGSVTAWSNNVSIYSVPNDDPDAYLSDQAVVDEITHDLTRQFGTKAVDIPAGISFAMMIRRETLQSVGLMDTVFGRGYCEETDWSLRSLQAGWRLTLLPGVFVYHAGRGSTVEAGMLTGGGTTVEANERIIDHRYPGFRQQVAKFQRSGTMQDLVERGLPAMLRGAAARHGLDVEVAAVPRVPLADDPVVHARIAADRHGAGLQVLYRGFRLDRPLEDPVLAADAVRKLFPDVPVAGAILREPTPPARLAAQSLASAGIEVRDSFSYPERV